MNTITTGITLDTVQVRRRYLSPRSRVAQLFQDRTVLEKWFAPEPDITVRITSFDFREGGDFRIAYDKPDGRRWVVAGTYTTIDLPDQLAFTWQWQAPDPHAGIQTQVHLRFMEDGDATEVILTHCKLTSDDLRTRHRTGWEMTLASLLTFLECNPTVAGSHNG